MTARNINMLPHKANTTLAFLQCNLSPACSSHMEQNVVRLMLIKPIIEYLSTVWDSYIKEDIYKLEMAQGRSARFICNNYNSTVSVTNLLQCLYWPTL